MTDAAKIEKQLAALPEPQQSTARALRATLLELLPKAEEAIKYGMPALTVEGIAVAGYNGFAKHCSYFPMSGSVIETVIGSGVALPANYEVAKGTLQFPVDKPPTKALVRKLVKARLDEISAVDNGKRHEFFPDGGLKAVGGMKDGQLHGQWRWFRADGSLKRTGRFKAGEQVGTWETFDAEGTLVSSKKMG